MSEPCKCGTKFCKHNKAQVWSCGGGTQSCAIAALIVQGKLPKPDFAVMADTGREVYGTFEYAHKWVIPNLAKVGVSLCIVASKYYATVDLWSGVDDETIVIPAYSTMGGLNSKLSNYCTNEWKVRVINRWLKREHGVTEYIKWIGFSMDEVARVLRMKKSQPETFFPLVEHRLNRHQCILLVESMGWPTPPRSRCWCCPNQSDNEWRSLPEIEMAKAIQLERDIQLIDPDAWLHRSCIPLDQVDFSQPEDLFSRPCDSGMCFV